jgi:hypothetical protein
MDLNGNRKRAWSVNIIGDIPGYVNVNGTNEIFIEGIHNIQSYDTIGDVEALITAPNLDIYGKAVFDSKGRMIVVQNQSGLLIFNTQGQIIAKYGLPNNLGYAGLIYASYINGKNFLYLEFSSNEVLMLNNLLP